MEIIETYLTGGFNTKAFIFAILIILVGLFGLLITIIMCDKYNERDKVSTPAILCVILVCVGTWLAIISNEPQIKHQVIRVDEEFYEKFYKEYTNSDIWEIEKDVLISNKEHKVIVKEKIK